MRLSAIIVLVDLQMWCATRADSALGCVGAEVLIFAPKLHLFLIPRKYKELKNSFSLLSLSNFLL